MKRAEWVDTGMQHIPRNMWMEPENINTEMLERKERLPFERDEKKYRGAKEVK